MIKIEDKIKKSEILLKNIKEKLNDLKTLHREISSHWTFEDKIYRYYHQSYKVYNIQAVTEKMVEQFKSLIPGGQLNERFINIVEEGTGKIFDNKHNEKWEDITRPMVEAFFHAKFFLEMMIKYGNELEKSPEALPSGWAAVLYLYNLR